MRRALLSQGLIFRRGQPLPLQQLLQGGFVIRHGQGNLLLARPKGAHQRGCGIKARVQINGRQHGLHGVGQHGRAFAPAGDLAPMIHAQVAAQLQVPRHGAQRFLAHHARAQKRHAPLLLLGVGGKDDIAHGQLQHRIAQELQPLIVFSPAGGVGERQAQKRGIMKMILQRFFKMGSIHG